MTPKHNKDITVGFYTSQADIGDSGVGVYQKNVVKAFSKLKNENIELRCIHYEASDMDIYEENRDIIIPQPQLTTITGRAEDNVSLRHHKNYSSEYYLNKYDLDIIHIQSIPYKRPFWMINDDTKIVSTIHSPWNLVTDRPWKDDSILQHIKFDIIKNFIYSYLSNKIDKIVTVSEYMKSKLTKNFNINKEKIRVIYNAPDTTDYSQTSRQLPIQEQPSKYILHVSHLNNRKNPEGVIKGFEIARRNYGIAEDLIIAGGGWKQENIDQYVLSGDINKNIHILGYIPRQLLTQLYRNASMLLLPSYLESCSLAQLESMSYQTPVVTTNSGGLPEVGGEANLYVDNPDDHKQIGQVITECLSRTDQLQKKSRRQIEKFSWTEHASKLAEVYYSTV